MKKNKVVKFFFQLLAGVVIFLPFTSTNAEISKEEKASSDLTIQFEPGKVDGDAITIHFGPGPSGAVAIHFESVPGEAKVIHFGPGPGALKSIHFGPGPSAHKPVHFGAVPSPSRAVSIHFGPGPASNRSAIAENESNQNEENFEG